MLPQARAYLDSALDDSFSNRPRTTYASEVIIGAGFHAAVYAAARVANGYPMPLVLERSNRAGGAFAMSREASFYLNSYNRPGLLGEPTKGNVRDGQALNYLPGALIQPADLSGNEFQTNADMAFIIRLTLATFANVRCNREVASVNRANYGGLTLTLADGSEISAKRVIDSRGIGDPDSDGAVDGRSVLTFPQFMAHMDRPTPLQGFKRVAVIGGGDSGKCAVEALLGIGPSTTISPASLDYVQSVDWFGTDLPTNTADWRKYGEGSRGRYQRIGSYLPRASTQTDRFGNAGRFGNVVAGSAAKSRLTVRQQRAEVTRSLGSLLVNDSTFDHVIVCAGNSLPALVSGLEGVGGTRAGTVIAKKAYDLDGFYAVGPCASIEFSTAERTNGIADIPANAVGMFRLANRTAALATMLKGA